MTPRPSPLQIEELLGLSFEHFCTCVVLPQGEFAALLHAEPRKRQDMLLALLDLGLYEAMGQAARSRATAAAAQVEVLDRQVAELADASEETLKEAERRVGVLDRLVERIDEARPRLEELVTVIAAAKAEADEAARRVATLTDLAVPDDVARLATKADAARKELDQARKDHEAAAAFLEQAEAATGDLPDRVALRERLTLLARRAEQAERIRTGATLEGERTEVLAATVAVREEADADYAAGPGRGGHGQGPGPGGRHRPGPGGGRPLSRVPPGRARRAVAQRRPGRDRGREGAGRQHQGDADRS